MPFELYIQLKKIYFGEEYVKRTNVPYQVSGNDINEIRVEKEEDY